MTIRPGDAWGREVDRPEHLIAADSDHAVVEALNDRSGRAVEVRRGDLARTLGVTGGAGSPTRDTLNELPIDLLEVTLDDREPLLACAHVVAHAPWFRGHWLRGPVLAVMNVEFIGDWDVAVRGHPNDGRVEVFEVSSAMTVRHRLGARRRLPSASHLPHPDIRTRSVRAHSWRFPYALDVTVDGRRAGRAASVGVTVLAGEALVHA